MDGLVLRSTLIESTTMKTSRRRAVARLLACVVAAIAIESVESFKIKIRRGESECIYAVRARDETR